MTNNIINQELSDTETQLLEAMSLQDNDIPSYKAYAGQEISTNNVLTDVSKIVEAIKTVFDPEIPINIYDLGLIYKIDLSENGNVHIDMTLTAPGCPVAGILPQQVADAVASLSGVGLVEVEIVWEPAWTIERLSDDAKTMLEMM